MWQILEMYSLILAKPYESEVVLSLFSDGCVAQRRKVTCPRSHSLQVATRALALLCDVAPTSIGRYFKGM